MMLCLCCVQSLFLSYARSICRPFAPRSLLASSLIWSTPTSIILFLISCVPHLHIKYFFLKRIMDLTSSIPISTDSLTPSTPAFEQVCYQFILTMFYCLLRPGTHRLMQLPFFGAKAFTFRFRLECFAVYASSLLLPPETQDSLHGGAGFTFHGGTFTHKIGTTFLLHPGSWRKGPFPVYF